MGKMVKNRMGQLSPFQGDDVQDAVAAFKANGGKVIRGPVAVGCKNAGVDERGFVQSRLARKGK